MAVTDPLPFVPATIIEGNERSGRPSALTSDRIWSRPSLIPICSRANSLARSSDVGCATRLHADRFGLRLGFGRGGHAEQSETPADRGFELAPIDDGVDEAFLEEELAALESLRQFLSNRLFDDAWAGKADERFGLGEI